MGEEDEKERLDRELIELLNELRVMATGVQMLFGFLLTVAFSQRFGAVSSLDRDVYFATLLSTATSSIALHQRCETVFLARCRRRAGRSRRHAR